MTEYRLLTTWRIEAPLERVYSAVRDTAAWPRWWPSARRVEALAEGDADGLGSLWRYVWRGRLPYRLAFDLRVTRIEQPVAIEGTAHGDLEGIGRWCFGREGSVCVVTYEWHVHCRRWWMRLLAPPLRRVFVLNHRRVMEQGGEALARLLDARLVGQETVDLAPARPPPRPVAIALAGLAAGTLATLAQLALWWLTGVPLLETLLRDSQLTAAIVLGQGVLPPPIQARWDVLLAATLLHFALSVAYAVFPACVALPSNSGKLLWLGAGYGLVVYGANLYGFALLYPWFEVARGWTTLVVHLVFGIVLLAATDFFRMRGAREP